MTRDPSLSFHSTESWDVLTASLTPVEEQSLPIRSLRSRDQPEENSLRLELHPLAEQDGIIVSVTPPKAPAKAIKHVPCDIVLVIDVSGSMNCPAPIPPSNESDGGSDPESDAGLSVLDLVKHAARTIVETLHDKDRLGIVTYGSDAEVIQELIWMNKRNKRDTVSRIERLVTDGYTNMWHGMKEGIHLFKDAPRSSNVAAMMVLTDGMPNHMCPPQGYVPKLRTYAQLPASIHTFGFGYSIRSGLLKSIAEVGGGNYAFIPDAGMIGTVFIHAVANLQSTFAINASLTINTPPGLKLAETCGETVEQAGSPGDVEMSACETIVIPIGNIQYGQSRDIYLQYVREDVEPVDRSLYGVQARLTYNEKAGLINNERPGEASANPKELSTFRSITNITSQPPAWAVYHRTRSSICRLLSTLFPIREHDSEHIALTENGLTTAKVELDVLIQNLKSLNLQDELNQSLLSDLSAPEPHGQVSLALSNPKYWTRWGRHYLPSLWNAHSKQICNSFKDLGPKMYGRDAPLFIKCRDELDDAFDNLPAPKPSRKSEGWLKKAVTNGTYVAPKMSRWNRFGSGCFAGHCEVELADGKMIALENLRRGMKVWTAAGPRAVVEIVKMEAKITDMCVLGECLLTPYHPVMVEEDSNCRHGATGGWMFPNDIAERKMSYDGAIYSIMLQRGADERARRIKVGGIVAVTLGHGILGNTKGDARAHDFFGSYDAVQKSLENLSKDERGVRLAMGITKGANGLANGFATIEKVMEVEDLAMSEQVEVLVY